MRNMKKGRQRRSSSSRTSCTRCSPFPTAWPFCARANTSATPIPYRLQQSLTDMMVGRAVSRNIDRPLNENQTERLRVEHLTVKNKGRRQDARRRHSPPWAARFSVLRASPVPARRNCLSPFPPAEAGGRQQNYIHRARRDRMSAQRHGPARYHPQGLLLSFVPETGWHGPCRRHEHHSEHHASAPIGEPKAR